MNLAIDIGNTAVKWATFDGHTLVDSGLATDADALPAVGGFDRVLACASGNPQWLDAEVPRLDSTTHLPIAIDYLTPNTLGPDRIAAACGAWALHRGEACMIVDAGTCITADLLDADGTYHGGVIMPGLKMNLQALHTFTAKLPLLDIANIRTVTIPGRSTEESIVAGTLGTTLLALRGIADTYGAKAAGLRVLLTGGDAELLARNLQWEHQRHLTLMGLNEIMMNNDNE